MYDANTPAITYGLRGIIALEFIIRGPAADVHSGAYGGGIANPAMVAAQILAKCVSPDGKVLVPGFYDDVVPLQDWERESFRKLNFNDAGLAKELNVPRLHGEAGYSTLERLWARPTFEVNGIFGGYQGQRSKTIIPASATVKITCRLVSQPGPGPRPQAGGRSHPQRLPGHGPARDQRLRGQPAGAVRRERPDDPGGPGGPEARASATRPPSSAAAARSPWSARSPSTSAAR